MEQVDKQNGESKGQAFVAQVSAPLKKGYVSAVGLVVRVMIIPDGDMHFAQGLEIDYAAQGASLDDVKKAFEIGLEATIQAHLKEFGTLENLVVPAPAEALIEFGSMITKPVYYSQISVHLHDQIQGITFISPAEEKVAC